MIDESNHQEGIICSFLFVILVITFYKLLFLMGEMTGNFYWSVQQNWNINAFLWIPHLITDPYQIVAKRICDAESISVSLRNLVQTS